MQVSKYDGTVNLRFVSPMECLSVKKLPLGAQWTYEVKLDGFRIEAIRTEDRDHRKWSKRRDETPPPYTFWTVSPSTVSIPKTGVLFVPQ